MIRVIIADDHHLVRHGIRALLDRATDIEVVAEASTGQEAVDLVRELQPHVVVMDISMPQMDGAQASKEIIALNLPVEILILSMYSDSIVAHQLLREGVKGYLLKTSIADELPLAIRAASNGRSYLTPAISGSVLDRLMAPQPAGIPANPSELLTPREQEVLELIAAGHTNDEIADMLAISAKTVEKHRGALMSKLDVHDLATLIRRSIQHGLILREE